MGAQQFAGAKAALNPPSRITVPSSRHGSERRIWVGGKGVTERPLLIPLLTLVTVGFHRRREQDKDMAGIGHGSIGRPLSLAVLYYNISIVSYSSEFRI